MVWSKFLSVLTMWARAGVQSEHSSHFRTSSGWVDAESGDGEGKRKAGMGGHPCALLFPCPCPAKFMW